MPRDGMALSASWRRPTRPCSAPSSDLTGPVERFCALLFEQRDEPGDGRRMLGRFDHRPSMSRVFNTSRSRARPQRLRQPRGLGTQCPRPLGVDDTAERAQMGSESPQSRPAPGGHPRTFPAAAFSTYSVNVPTAARWPPARPGRCRDRLSGRRRKCRQGGPSRRFSGSVRRWGRSVRGSDIGKPTLAVGRVPRRCEYDRLHVGSGLPFAVRAVTITDRSPWSGRSVPTLSRGTTTSSLQLGLLG